MKAELHTRCGCVRRFEVQWPPPPEWHVPLRERGGITVKAGMVLEGEEFPKNEGPLVEDAAINIERRVFTRNPDTGKHPEDFVWYEE